MRESLISKISCPKISKKILCRGSLKIISAGYFKNRQDEIAEGLMKCQKCGQSYPVLAGIPIILDDLGTYLRHNYHFIKGASRAHGFFEVEMDRFFFLEMMAAYKDKKEKLRPAQTRYNKRTLREADRGLASYLINHYDKLENIVGPNEPFYEFITKSYHPTPHEVLENFLLKHLNGKKVQDSLDIGCNVGGMSAKLSDLSKDVFSMDISFYNLLTASGIVKGLPERVASYRLLDEPNRFKKREIKRSPRENVEFILASGTNLPFKENEMDVVLSSNVIDIIDNPKRLLEEKMRVAKIGGLVLSSDPYQFFKGLRDDSKRIDKDKPKARILKILKSKMKILDERENTVWLSRNYNRSYMLYFNHSFCARKDKV